MGPIYMASALAEGRRHEQLQKAERRRLTAARPESPGRPGRAGLSTGPGLVQRFALRAAGWGQRPAVVASATVLVPQPQACEPAAG